MMFISSNLAMSLDGKIATASRVHFPLGTPYDRKLMRELRARADAVLMGASTVRAFRKPCRAMGLPKGEAQPWNIVVSSEMRGMSPSWEFFRAPDLRRLVFVQRMSRAVERFRDCVDVVVLKRREPIARQVARELAARGIKRLLVEGGAEIMWEFARLNLIDEYHVTLTPRIVGGVSAPTLVGGNGFSPSEVLNLRLKQCRRVGNELYLVYRKTTRRGSSSGS